MRKKGSNRKVWTEMETGSFIKRLFEELQREAANKKTALRLEESLPGKLRLDSAFLEESFLGLFPHCAQNTEEETIFFSVFGDRLEQGGHVLRISVSEGGEGFSEEELEFLNGRKEICEDAFLSKLYEVRRGADERGGSFSIYSKKGGGAVFYMILPCESLTSQTVGDMERKEIGLHNVETVEIKTGENQQEPAWIDRKLALNYAGGMEEMRLELLGIYYEQAQQYMKELPKLVEAKDWKKYRITVHAIKGNSLGIGAEGFSKEAYEQEIAAKDGDIQKIEREFPQFYLHFQSLVEEVKKGIV